MAEHIKIQYGTSPDGLRTIAGFQPPLSEELVDVAESAIIDYLDHNERNLQLGATAIVKRIPDHGESYSEFMLTPLQLADSRAEALANKLVPFLLDYVAAE